MKKYEQVVYKNNTVPAGAGDYVLARRLVLLTLTGLISYSHCKQKASNPGHTAVEHGQLLCSSIILERTLKTFYYIPIVHLELFVLLYRRHGSAYICLLYNNTIIHFIETRLQKIQLAQQQKDRWLGSQVGK